MNPQACLRWIVLILFITSCGSQSSVSLNDAVSTITKPKYLYIASGSCYAGGVTVSTGPSNTIAKFNVNTGVLEQVVVDYNAIAPGDSPVSIADYNDDYMLALIENTSGRRVDLIKKDGTGISTYLVNTTALGAVTRAMLLMPDFSLLVSKSGAIEKFNSGKSRVMSGANPWINAPGGACATATTLISSMTADSTGKIIFTHAAATPNNRIDVIKSGGYSVVGDCLSGTAGPVTTALPTRALFLPNGKLMVSFGSTTLTSNLIYSYDYNSATGALSNPVAIFNDGGSVVNGPSAMAINPDNGQVFVANANSTYNNVERFTYASNALTRVTGPTFIPYNVYTRCVSDMRVMK